MPKDIGGAPTKYQKHFHPQNYLDLSNQGKCLAQIAREWNVHRDTIYEWANKHPRFSDAIKKGKQICEAWYMDLGQSAMIGQARVGGLPIRINNTMFVWMTKNLFKWTDKVDVNSIGPLIPTAPTEEPEVRRQRLRDKIRKLNILDES